MTSRRTYGWRKQPEDSRDIRRVGVPVGSLPQSVDLRQKMPPVYDQGQLGSCTANAICAAVQFLEKRDPLSRLFLYFEERRMEGTVSEDAGAIIRDGFKVLRGKGVCSEKLWPYLPAKFATKPSASAYLEANRHEALAYHAVAQTEDHLREALASGLPVVFGFTVYPSFESTEVAKSGIVPMPSLTEAPLGGHAVIAVGYDDSTRRFLVRNSWGTGWGQKGYFWMPYDYVTNPSLASDFWVLSNVE